MTDISREHLKLKPNSLSLHVSTLPFQDPNLACLNSTIMVIILLLLCFFAVFPPVMMLSASEVGLDWQYNV